MELPALFLKPAKGVHPSDDASAGGNLAAAEVNHPERLEQSLYYPHPSVYGNEPAVFHSAGASADWLSTHTPVRDR